jgi:sugar lactone lactonase YvrE
MSIEIRDADVVLRAQATLGESPVWETSTQTIVWVDIPLGEVHRFDPATGTDTFATIGQPVGAALPDHDDELVLAAADGFYRLRKNATLTRLAGADLGTSPSRMNDAKVDGAGRIVAGTIALDLHKGGGSLLRLDPDGLVTCIADGLTVPNGLGWSPDGTTFYFIDSFAYGVDAWDYDPDTAALHNRRRFVDLPASGGLGDGLTVDADGGVWVALFGGSRLQRFTPDGRADRHVALPVTQVTAAAFCGDAYDVLYITTARSDENGPMTDAALSGQLLAGAIFAVDVGVGGLPPVPARI